MINTCTHKKNAAIARSMFPGILFSALLFLSACHNDPKEVSALTGGSVAQEDKATDVTIIYSDGGKVKARLYAKEFIRNDKAKYPYTDMKKRVYVEFFNDSMKVDNTLSAKYARYYDAQQNVLVRDSIVVKNRKGEQLNTEELVWNQQKQRFFTEKFVRITTPTRMLYGDGLEANQDFTWYTIKHLKGTVQVNKSQIPQ
ncbi:LPS export ABC transporter periplasmic protein LptC [Chitinophagaceae bacterium MMS25-I14]